VGQARHLRHSALQHLAADGRTAPELQAKSRHQHLTSLGRYVRLGEQTSVWVTAEADPGAPSMQGAWLSRAAPMTPALLLTSAGCEAEYVRHYNGHRPHQGLQQEPPRRQSNQTANITAPVERKQVLGGLISEYRRAA
jgi:hypothetical protein